MDSSNVIKLSKNLLVYDADGNGQFNAGDRIYYKGQETTTQDPRVQVETRIVHGLRSADRGNCRQAVRDFAEANSIAQRAGIRFDRHQAVQILREKMCLPAKDDGLKFQTK